MDEQSLIQSAFALGVLLGAVSLICAHKSRYLWCLLILIAAPLGLAIVEFNFYPAEQGLVSVSTGLLTFLFSILWGPYWLLQTAVGWWLGRTKPSP